MRYFSRSLIFGSIPNNALKRILKESSVPFASYKLLASLIKLLISNCGERFLAVVESRLNRQGHRRRKKHCLNCNYRLTTVELPETEADKLVDKSSLVCQMCMHNDREKMCCDFETPEYMTPDSQDCNLFKKRS